MTGTALYEGQVMHTRPPDVRGRYLFRYGVYLWLIDLDALPRLPRLLAPLGRVRSRDHLGDPERSIRENVDGFLAERGVDLEGGRVLLLTNPRSFGYVFNPLSVYWCHDRDGDLRCIVAEVHNTHGQRHCYLLEPGERGRAEADKAFYVSPFLTVDGRYRMSFSPPDERLSIQMELIQDERPGVPGVADGTAPGAVDRAAAADGRALPADGRPRDGPDPLQRRQAVAARRAARAPSRPHARRVAWDDARSRSRRRRAGRPAPGSRAPCSSDPWPGWSGWR